MSNNKSRSNKPKKIQNQENNKDLYDTELKDDYMSLIKAQNKKIQGLFSEIEKKDKLLSQFQIQLKTLEEIKVENNFLKSQINALTEDYKQKFEKNMEEIKEKEEINSELLIDLENIKQLLNEYKAKYELIQKENISNIEKVNQSLNSERDYESKAKELVHIIQSQDAEIKNFTEVVTGLKKVTDETKKNNEDLIKENEILQKQNNEHENVMLNMNSAIEDLKIKLKKQGDKNEVLNKSYQISINKIKELEKEIKTLKNQNNELLKTTEKEHNQISLYPKAISDVLSYFKTVMNSGYFWASTYIKPHLEYTNLEAIIADNGFILDPKELINNIQNNFSFLKSKNESFNMTKIIGEIYQEFVELIKNLYNEINEEFIKLNNIINNQKNGNTELLSKINNIENNSSRLKEEFKKTVDENKINEKSLNEHAIDIIYHKLIDIIKSNLDILNSNNNFFNIDDLSNLIQKENENDIIAKLNVVKTYLLNFTQLAINSLSELSNQNDIINDYNRLKEECKKMNKELVQFKKEYSILVENYDNSSI